MTGLAGAKPLLDLESSWSERMGKTEMRRSDAFGIAWSRKLFVAVGICRISRDPVVVCEAGVFHLSGAGRAFAMTFGGC